MIVTSGKAALCVLLGKYLPWVLPIFSNSAVFVQQLRQSGAESVTAGENFVRHPYLFGVPNFFNFGSPMLSFVTLKFLGFTRFTLPCSILCRAHCDGCASNNFDCSCFYVQYCCLQDFCTSVVILVALMPEKSFCT